MNKKIKKNMFQYLNMLVAVYGVCYVVYLNRYTLGLASPKFGVGDCAYVQNPSNPGGGMAAKKISSANGSRYGFIYFDYYDGLRDGMSPSDGDSYEMYVEELDEEHKKMDCPEIYKLNTQEWD